IERPPGFAGAGDGVIGNELFDRYALRIDAEEKRLAGFQGARFVPHRQSTVVPLRMRGHAPFVEARVSVGAEEPILADLAIDLGARHALWLNEREDGRLGSPERSSVESGACAASSSAASRSTGSSRSSPGRITNPLEAATSATASSAR